MTDTEYVSWPEMTARERQRYIDEEISGKESIAHITID